MGEKSVCNGDETNTLKNFILLSISIMCAITLGKKKTHFRSIRVNVAHFVFEMGLQLIRLLSTDLKMLRERSKSIQFRQYDIDCAWRWISTEIYNLMGLLNSREFPVIDPFRVYVAVWVNRLNKISERFYWIIREFWLLGCQFIASFDSISRRSECVLAIDMAVEIQMSRSLKIANFVLLYVRCTFCHWL